MRNSVAVKIDQDGGQEFGAAYRRFASVPLGRLVLGLIDPDCAQIERLRSVRDKLLSSHNDAEILGSARTINRALRLYQSEPGGSKAYQHNRDEFIGQLTSDLNQLSRVIPAEQRLGLVVALNGVTHRKVFDSLINAVLLDRSEDVRTQALHGMRSEAVLMHPDFTASVLEHLKRIGEQTLLPGRRDVHFRHELVASLVSVAALTLRGYTRIEKPLISLLTENTFSENDRIHALQAIREQWRRPSDFVHSVVTEVCSKPERAQISDAELREIEATRGHCLKLISAARSKLAS